MGEQEGWLQPPNGLLPDEGGSVMRVVDTEQWDKAERRTAELIACIQPNELSEQRRNAVAAYVQNLIMKCFPCHVFTFGSVPLKTYLPDGDIDLTAFSNDQNLKDTWAHHVRDALENEEKNENAEFRVKEVQYIQAEVKLIKCLVENIVVDISFNQLGGLCTLCFLDEVDNLINQNHLFKRSIILIKAWCYYESRVLGAHHGLISTYALETLVLYIFNVFNNSFAGPLEVLYRFLKFFSKFDWNNFCVSLWGPLPISSLPDATAVEAPRKDGGDLLLNKLFLEACSLAYSVLPPQEHQGHPFVSKHLNIIDPLRTNNNLGRSVSKGNFFRIRSAFAYGAKCLGRVLECPKEDIYNELNQFFMNTWERHGSGLRPDVPRSKMYCGRAQSGLMHEDLKDKGNRKKDGSLRDCENQIDGVHRLCDTSPVDVSVESSCRNGDVAAARVQDQKRSGSLDTSETSDSIRPVSSFSYGVPTETVRLNSKPNHLVNDVQRRHLFSRTHSSPELTDNYSNFSSQQRFNVPESKRSLAAPATLDNRWGKNLESDNYASHSIRSSKNMPSSVRSVSSSQSGDTVASSNSAANSFCNGSDFVTFNLKDDTVSGVETQGMHQGEQDLGSMMTSSTTHGHNGRANVPFNSTLDMLPLPASQPFHASVGFPHRNLGGMFRADIPFIENPWGANMQFPPGPISKPPTHYFHKVDLTSCSGEPVKANSENFEIVDTNRGEKEHDYWQEHGGPNGRYDQNHGGFEMHQLEEKLQSSPGNKFGLSPMGNVRSSARMPPRSSKSNRGSREDDYADMSKHQENSGNEVYYEDGRASPRSSSDGLSRHSVKGKAPSEDSWKGSTTKFPNPTGEKQGRKSSTTMVSSTAYGKGKCGSEHSSIQAEGYSKNWNPSSLMVTELSESTGPQSVPPLHDPRLQIAEHELAQTSSSGSVTPTAPLLFGSRQRVTDDSGAVPFAFYPTGPPVPFVMVPLYNFPSEMGNAEPSNRHYNSEEGIVECDSGQNLDSPEVSHQPDVSGSMSMASSAEPEEHRSDILNGDFASHWQNLQFGRFCQNSQIRAPLLYPSPMMAPPVYLQGHYPWDGSGRPISADASLVNQFMSHGPRMVPVSPLRALPNRPAGLYQHYMDEIPKHRSGTGTYLPNPASLRDRHSTSTRRGANRSQHSNYDRSDHADRENSWNTSSKSRTAGRNQNPRQEQIYPSESRAGGAWDPNRHDSSSSFDSQNGPIRGSDASTTDMPYGVYPLTALNPSGMSSNGPNAPPLVMLYPYDRNSPYRPTAEQLEFGSLGRVGFSGSADTSPLSEGTVSGGAFEEQRVNGGSARQTTSDQPSSPHFRS